MTQPLALDLETSPRERLLSRAGGILQRGAFVNAGIAGVVLLLGVIAATRVIPNLFETLRGVLLLRYAGTGDFALAIVILLALLNLSLLLVVMVGVVAREIWTLPALVLLVIGNRRRACPDRLHPRAGDDWLRAVGGVGPARGFTGVPRQPGDAQGTAR